MHIQDHDDFGGLQRDLRATGVQMDRRRLFSIAARLGVGISALDLLACGAHHLQLRTDRDWLTDVIGFVDRRRRHGWRAAAAPGPMRARAAR